MNAPGGSTSSRRGEPPLAVDLDGTLINSDSLYEGFVQVLKRDPLALIRLPWWLVRGKAAVKGEIADRVDLDVAFLPYNSALIARLREQRDHRRLVLCTAADHRFAHAVANHLELFHEVMATEANHNLGSKNKARALVGRYGAGGFDYAGNNARTCPCCGSTPLAGDQSHVRAESPARANHQSRPGPGNPAGLLVRAIPESDAPAPVGEEPPGPRAAACDVRRVQSRDRVAGVACLRVLLPDRVRRISAQRPHRSRVRPPPSPQAGSARWPREPCRFSAR